MDPIELRQVQTEMDRKAAGALVREYLEWLNVRLQRDYGMSFDVQSMVESDLSDRHKFYPPRGRFYLARLGSQIAGVGCLKELQNGVGELQRMYVSPSSRRRGIGKAIAERLIADARSLGYRQLRLESLEFLHAAHSLYKSLGFRDIDRYPENSMEAYQAPEQLNDYYGITTFMEMDL